MERLRLAHAYCLLVLACCRVLFTDVAIATAQPTPPTPRWCLTPAVSKVFEDLAANGALRRVLRDQFTLERADVGQNQIALEIKDEAQQLFAATLALEEIENAKPDGRGRHFLFYLGASAGRPNPHATTALLAIAAVVDAAISEDALQLCGGEHAAQAESQPVEALDPAARPEPQGQPNVEDGYPLGLALASAAAQVMVLVAAIVSGLRAIRSRDAAIDTNS